MKIYERLRDRLMGNRQVFIDPVGGIKTSPPDHVTISRPEPTLCGTCRHFQPGLVSPDIGTCTYSLPKYLVSGWRVTGGNASPCATWSKK